MRGDGTERAKPHFFPSSQFFLTSPLSPRRLLLQPDGGLMASASPVRGLRMAD